MPSEQSGVQRLRSFVLGGIVGASAVAELRRRRRRRRRKPVGLAAFEGAPCFREHEIAQAQARTHEQAHDRTHDQIQAQGHEQ